MNRGKRIFFRELQLGILWTQAETGHQYAPAKVYKKVPDSGQKMTVNEKLYARTFLRKVHPHCCQLPDEE